MAKKQAAEVADSLRQFKQDLKNNTLGNFYIFCGEEAFLRDYYLAELTRKLSNGPAAEFNVHRFDAASICAAGASGRGGGHADDGRADARACGRYGPF